MKRKGRVLLITIAMLVIITTITVTQAASSAQPGSEFDPLVTKSYVDEQIQKLSQKIGTGTSTGGTSTGSVSEQVLNNVRTDVRDLTNLLIEAYSRISTLEELNREMIQKMQTFEQGFVVVEASKGQIIRLGAGTELLLRSGEATAVSGELGGLADATGAQDLNNGISVPNQHLLISSRKDGRGISITSEKAFMIIRGSYTLE